MNKEFVLPVKGYSLGIPPNVQPAGTTGYMDNIIPRGALEKWIRLVQRPGLDKVFAQQVGGDTLPVVLLLSVTTID